MTTGEPVQPEPTDPEHDSRPQFHEALLEIQQGLVQMASLVLENVRRSGDAMVNRRLDLIEEVKAADTEVDRRYLELENLTFQTIATQAPVATDLRFLISASRILYELERTGDLAVNNVKMLERQEGFPDAPIAMGLLEQLVDATCRVFAMSIDAIADLEPEAGPLLDEADDEVDALVSRYYTAIAAVSKDIGLEARVNRLFAGRQVCGTCPIGSDAAGNRIRGAPHSA